MFDKVHIKLVAYYSLIIMLISISFSYAIYRISTKELTNSYNRQAIMLQDGIFQVPARHFERVNAFRNQQIKESKSRLIANLLYYNLIILVVAVFLSYKLAIKTLEPIFEAMESQERFTADASHELRTPLTAMKTEIEVFLRDRKYHEKNVNELLESNLEEIQRLEVLSSGLLKLARHNGGGASSNFVQEELSEIMLGVVKIMNPLANKKEMVFNLNLAKVEIMGDRNSLVELFTILLDNAIKYGQKKTGIDVSLYRLGKGAVIKIQNTGRGIKSTDLPHIFDRFYRADQSRSKVDVDGYGLGLSIAKKIVVAHEGKIGVESRLDEETVFTVTLPAIK